MEEIFNKQAISKYIEEYEINNYFSENIIDDIHLYKFNVNEHICKTDEEISNLYFFVEGKAKVYNLLENGKSFLLRFYNPLQIIGDLEVFKEEYATSNVQAISDCYCLGISFNTINEKYKSDSTFLLKMGQSISHKLVTISKHSSINQLYTVEERLASYLFAVSNAARKNKREIQTSNLTDLSNLLGCSYRHLLRVINDLIDREIIMRDRSMLKILNMKKLKRIAGDIYE